MVADDLTHRFVELVRRELGAHDVVITTEDASLPNTVRVPLAEDRVVVASFEDDRSLDTVTVRRLEILVRAFEAALLGEPQKRERVPVVVSLREELRVVVARSGALGAVVIDAHSPIVWAATSERLEGPVDDEPDNVLQFPPEARETLRLVRESHRGVLIELGVFSEPPPELETPWEETEPANEEGESALLAAIRAVRALPTLSQLHKSAHLSHTERQDDGGFTARSFAGIYCLVVVFDHPWDEIRAERSVRDSLPRIERLVLALPPLDPEPTQRGAVARRPRRS